MAAVKDIHELPNCPDIVVAGGGLAGTALATLFARDGKQVVVIDKDMGEQETMAGEILQPGTYKALQRMRLEGSLFLDYYLGCGCNVPHIIPT